VALKRALDRSIQSSRENLGNRNMKQRWMVPLLAPWMALMTSCGGGKSPTSSPTPVPLSGVVSINFDDGYESTFNNAVPILDAAGLKATFYIITKRLDTPTYMTTGQMFSLVAEGHEIGAHTRHHPHLVADGLTPAQQQDEIQGSLNDLKALGLNPLTFAYPYGDHNDVVVSIVKNNGFAGARDTRPGFDNAMSPTFLLNADVQQDSNSPDASLIIQNIDKAVANNNWLILVFHRVDENGNPISIRHEVIQQTVDHIIQNKVPVVTMNQGLQMFSLKP
jgi:peptidoglycan/xylan/chitin deacetylase (PgdA/CDA1 family)